MGDVSADPRLRLQQHFLRTQRLVDVTPDVLAWIRLGYDRFRAIQMLRVDLDLVPQAERYMTIQGHSVSAFNTIPEAIASRLEWIPALWRLCNDVTLIEWESIGDLPPVAVRYLQWHRITNSVADDPHLTELHRLCQDTQSEFSNEAYADLFSAAHQLIFQGERRVAAQLFASIIERIRGDGAEAIPHEMETHFNEILRLLVDPTLERDHSKWRRHAGVLVNEARTYLALTAEEIEDCSPLSSLRMVLLDFLLIAAESDGQHLRELCRKMQLDPTWRLAGTVALQRPDVDLRGLSSLTRTFFADSSCSNWCSSLNPMHEWFLEAVWSILTARNYYEIVQALGTCTDSFARAEIEARCEERMETDDDDDELGLELEANRWECFALRFMAAHLSDICAPAFFAVAPNDKIMFQRNHLVDLYVQQLEGHAALWKIALMYTVFTPMANPEIVVRQFERLLPLMCKCEDMLTQTLRDVRQQFALYLDRASPHQVMMRKAVARRVTESNAEPASGVIDSLHLVFDRLAVDSYSMLLRTALEHYWSFGKFAAAVALPRSVPSAVVQASNWALIVESRLRACFSSVDGVLQDVHTHPSLTDVLPPCVLIVGEAVRSGFVPIGSSVHPSSLAEVLTLCAHLYDVANADLPDEQIFNAIWHIFDSDASVPRDLKIILLEMAVSLLQSRCVPCTYDQFLTLHVGMTLLPGFVGCSRGDSAWAKRLHIVARDMVALQANPETRPTLAA